MWRMARGKPIRVIRPMLASAQSSEQPGNDSAAPIVSEIEPDGAYTGEGASGCCLRAASSQLVRDRMSGRKPSGSRFAAAGKPPSFRQERGLLSPME
jgi:hypothetical protein